MELSLAQLATLKAWVIANHGGVFDQSTVAALNADASPDFIVWRTSVTAEEVMQNGIDWARVDNLSVGKARIWDWMVRSAGMFNPSKPNVRAGIDATWVGTQADLNVRAAVYAHCKRKATVGEKMFSTGTGTDADPATMGIGQEGEVTLQNVISADS